MGKDVQTQGLAQMGVSLLRNREQRQCGGCRHRGADPLKGRGRPRFLN